MCYASMLHMLCASKDLRTGGQGLLYRVVHRVYEYAYVYAHLFVFDNFAFESEVFVHAYVPYVHTTLQSSS